MYVLADHLLAVVTVTVSDDDGTQSVLMIGRTAAKTIM